MALVSPDGAELSIVIESMTAAHSQCIRSNPSQPWSVQTQRVTFRLLGPFAQRTFSVWKSVLFPIESSFLFEQQPDITPETSGIISFTLEPDTVLTLSTTRGQAKGSAVPPAPAAFPAIGRRGAKGRPQSCAMRQTATWAGPR